MALLTFISKAFVDTCRSSAFKCGRRVGADVLRNWRRLCSSKPHCNIGTIGHIDHGKTTLTSAITKVLEEDGKTKFMSYDQIDRAPQEKARGITINACHVEYQTEARHYAHTDCPGHLDFIKNMIVGTSQMDGAILVVAATDGVMPQTREHILLARQIGVKDIVVYINKAELVDKEMLELVDLEVKELLQEMGYDSEKVPFIFGSALCALEGSRPELGKESIWKLVEVLDQKVTIPERKKTGQFIMPINTAFTVHGRGTVAVGTVRQGYLNKGDEIHVLGFGNDVKSFATDIQIFQKNVQRAEAGDNVGILLRGVKKELIDRGMFICTTYPERGEVPIQTGCFLARCYVQSKSEGGRTWPITSGYNGMMFVDTWNINCHIKLLPDDCPEVLELGEVGMEEEEEEGEDEKEEEEEDKKEEEKDEKQEKDETEDVKEEDRSSGKSMAMPGEVTFAKIYLRQPMILRTGQRFFVRESNKTTVTGLVTAVRPNDKVLIKGFNYEPDAKGKSILYGNCRTALRKKRSKK